MRKQLLAALIFSASAAPAQALADPFDSVEALRDACLYANSNIETTAEQDYYALACMAYLSGIEVGSTVTATYYKRKQLICAPASASLKQYAQVFVVWATQHPEYWNRAPTLAAAAALEDAFPCK